MSAPLLGPSVLALVGDKSGPTLWRVFWPFTALQKAGYRCGWDFHSAPGIGTIAPSFDGYVLPRMSWPPSQRPMGEAWFGAVRRAGKFVVFDADDDLLTAEITRRAVAMDWTDGKTFAELEADRFERIWAMQQCDGVTVSTQRLATVVRSYTNAPVIVVPNAIDLPWFRRVLRATRRQTQGVTIGWAGGKRPDSDVDTMAEAWGRIAQRFPDVRFVVQGYLPPVIAQRVPNERLVILPWLPLERYPAGLVEVDIACCSVADTPFNRAKSTIKAIEAAVAGSAVVATPTIYGQLIEHGVTGYLAETVHDWDASLASLVSSEATRRIMARRLLRVVERKCSLAVNLHRWPASWQTIAEHARERRGSLVVA